MTPPTAKAEDESRDYDDILERAFRIPHDRPPRWLLVFTAYVDETAHDRPNGTFVAGFMGNKTSWETLAAGWSQAIAPLKNLHLATNRKLWKYEKQLKNAAELTKTSGLKALVGSVAADDYKDLIPPQATNEGKVFAAWVLCMTTLILAALEAIPADEQLEIVYEQQFEYERYINVVCAVICEMPEFTSDDGMAKLVGCRPVSKRQTKLNQPADYLAHALLQDKDDPTSLKAKITRPILDAHPPEVRAKGLLDREMARLIVNRTFEEVALLEGGSSK